MSKPLADALEAVRIATEKVERARRYYDYLGTDTRLTLVDVHITMIEQQRKLDDLLTNPEIKEA